MGAARGAGAGGAGGRIGLGRLAGRTGLILALAGCSGPVDAGDGVIGLEVVAPVRTQLIVGDTLRLRARGLRANGDTLTIPVQWRSPDTTLSVSTTGLVRALRPGSGRVQVSYNTLISDFLTFSIVAPQAPSTP